MMDAPLPPQKLLDVLAQKLRNDLTATTGDAPTPINAIISGPGMGSCAIIKEIASLFASKENLPFYQDQNYAENAIPYIPGENRGVAFVSVSSNDLIKNPSLPETKKPASLSKNTKNNILHIDIAEGASAEAIFEINKILVDRKLSFKAPDGEEEDWVPKTIFLTGYVDADKMPQVVKNSMNLFFMEEPVMARLAEALAHRREVFYNKKPECPGPKELKV